MIVLCFGMPKSGSTLAFELCQALLVEKGFAQRRLPSGVAVDARKINFLGTVSIENLKHITDEVRSNEIIAIKLHVGIGPAEFDFVQSEVAKGNIKVHVNFRDPREICLSLVDAGVKARDKGRTPFSRINDLDDAAKAVVRQLRNCRQWGSIDGALLLYYNQVAFDTASAMERMCASFGFQPLTEGQLSKIVQHVFGQAFTQKNKAVINRYKDDLTVRQNEELLHKFPVFRAFIRKVCEAADYSWFKSAAGDGPVKAEADQGVRRLAQ